jgi:hypothetical protein
MAREVISLVNVWCDNAGRHDSDKIAATKSVVLAYDEKLVRLDLCDECRDEMASVLGEYAEYGDTVTISRTTKIDTTWTDVEKNDAIPAPEAKGGAKRRVPVPAKGRRPHETTPVGEVRAWLRAHTEEHKLPVPDRGPRLSGELNAVYDRGHGWDEIDGTWRPTAGVSGDAPAAAKGADPVPTKV